MNNHTEAESIVQEHIGELKSVPERASRAATRARARFLTQAVSGEEFQRHKGWNAIFRTEQFAMNILISILVIAGLLAGGGATVKAAQDDLPGEHLYGIKTWSEDVSLQFQNNPEARVERLMALAQTRVQEMTQMVEAGQTPPDQIRLRLEGHLQQALQLCSNMQDTALDRTLLQLRDQLQQQDRDMQRLQIHSTQDAQPILERTRTMLQTQLHVVDDGLLNHEIFRNTVRNGFHYGQTQTPPTAAPTTPPTPHRQQNNQATPQADPEGNNGPGPNPDPGGPNPSMTPMPSQDGSGTGSGSNPGGNEGGAGSGNNPGGNQEGEGSGSGGSGGGGSGGNRP
ncbi:MAG TPA: DUF5667 domain-containing protein [Anaerolineales bacterium]|nr:DUF5667 domain-containing protein [Anaerolineales bacterium]